MNTGIVEANLISLNQKFNLAYINDLIFKKSTESEKCVLKEAEVELYFKEYQRLQNELEIAFHNSHLPNEPSAKSELNNLLIEMRLKSITS